MQTKIEKIEEKYIKKEIPDFRPGDTVAVHLSKGKEFRSLREWSCEGEEEEPGRPLL